MPRPVLPGFTFERNLARYRDSSTGRFVARTRINELMEQQVNTVEDRLARIVQGVADKSLAPGAAQEMARDELRRLVLTNNALGKGGIDQLTFRDYGRVGQQLRDTYQRVTNLLDGVEKGNVTLPQAMNRIQGYVSEARQQFFAAQRDATMATGRQMEERRVLHAKESCVNCVDYAAQGWQPAGTLPLPGELSQCNKYCLCTLEVREVQQEERMAA